MLSVTKTATINSRNINVTLNIMNGLKNERGLQNVCDAPFQVWVSAILSF